MHEDFTTMAQVSAELRSIRELLVARDELDAERRETDDQRNSANETRSKELLGRIDGHGKRLARVESYFSQDGAFPIFSRVQNNHSKKIDRLTWFVGIGVGIVAALQFVLLLKH